MSLGRSQLQSGFVRESALLVIVEVGSNPTLFVLKDVASHHAPLLRRSSNKFPFLVRDGGLQPVGIDPRAILCGMPPGDIPRILIDQVIWVPQRTPVDSASLFYIRNALQYSPFGNYRRVCVKVVFRARKVPCFNMYTRRITRCA